MNILEIAIENKHLEYILFLVKEDPTLLEYELPNGTTVVENIKRLDGSLNIDSILQYNKNPTNIN